MSDSAQTPIPSSSYVDSYVPPTPQSAGNGGVPPAGANAPMNFGADPQATQANNSVLSRFAEPANQNVSSGQQTLHQKTDGDSLQKLEELVNEYGLEKAKRDEKDFSMAPAAPTPSSQKTDGDPLQKLEELVNEYEVQKAEREKEDISALNDLKALSEKKNGPEETDPLVELERVLAEYEEKYKKQAAEATSDSSEASQNDQPKQEMPAVSAEPDTVTSASPAPVAPPTSTSNPVTSPAVPPASPQTPSGGPQANNGSLAAALASTQPIHKEPTPEPQKVTPPPADESIEEQNIFEMLGVQSSSEKEKEDFLDELQHALWDDFLEQDIPLLVTDEELTEIRNIQNDASLDENKKQAVLVEKIEQLIPDIEEILLEKALELKEDMVWERVKAMKQQFASTPDRLQKIEQAERFFSEGRWKTGSELLNSLA